LKITGNGLELRPSFIALGISPNHQTLVFLEDLAQIAQQAQQLKLAALGRLTAGIAHEIRNPLGAISHAAQLLRESEELNGADRRLTQIIQDHSERMNRVIENVLQLSRRQQTVPQRLDLETVAGTIRGRKPRGGNRTAADSPAHHWCRLHHVDGSRPITQILDNLVRNGWRHSGLRREQAQVWLELFIDPNSQLPIRKLSTTVRCPPTIKRNCSNPSSPPAAGHRPGLYLSRELCESNQARLDFKPRQDGGCFRITFAHGRKQG
jgi:two-component system sensor histidine kinase PilS (NtrC family)